jgi:Mrp family chromosome partitioning ATPase
MAAEEVRTVMTSEDLPNITSSLGIRTPGAARPGGSIAPVVPRELPLPETDEVFRGIYTRAALGFGSEIIAVTSATSGEGKTTLGLGLAITIAQDFPDRRVLVIETALQRPVLCEDFGIESTPGLVDALLGELPISSACRPTFLDNLDLLPAGSATAHRGRLLRSAGMIAALESLREMYHLIILDAPSLLTNSDGLLLTDLSDAVLFVVRTGGGGPAAALVNKALEQIDEAKLRGIVLNGSPSSITGWLRGLLGMRGSGML